MTTFYLISTPISLFTAYMACFCLYKQNMVDYSGNWETAKERTRLPLWAVILIFTVAFVPIVNVSLSGLAVFQYGIDFLCAPLRYTRYIVRLPSNRLTRLLNRRI